MRKVLLLFSMIFFGLNSFAQHTMGISGLLNTPNARMNEDGTFMVGANYMPEEITPQSYNYNTANYFLNITFLRWLEVTYKCTLINTNNWKHQDRSVSFKMQPLREKQGHWWPSLVLGSNDALTSKQLNPLAETNSNRYFSGVYIAANKYLLRSRQDLDLTAGYFIPIKGRNFKNGFFAGLTYSPSFYKDLHIIAEYDSKVVNIGAAVLLFHHLSADVFCTDFKAFSVGLRFQCKLYTRKKD